VLIPLTFPFLGVEGSEVTLQMAWKAIRRRTWQRVLRPPLPEACAA